MEINDIWLEHSIKDDDEHITLCLMVEGDRYKQAVRLPASLQDAITALEQLVAMLKKRA